MGTTAILSDGGAVFQPRKVARSGLSAEFDQRVLICIHNEEEPAYAERLAAIRGTWKPVHDCAARRPVKR